jgi:hypothetical protein
MMESYIPAATGARLARALRTAALAGLTIGLTACSVFGIRTAEEARYRVLSTDGEFELREYENHVVAQTLVEATFDDAGGIAFGRLFRYISGENAGNAEMAMTAPVLVDPTVSGEKIEMTAPVIGRPVATGWRYQFVLPAEYTAANTPTPTDPAVTIEQFRARLAAALGRLRSAVDHPVPAAKRDLGRSRLTRPSATPHITHHCIEPTVHPAVSELVQPRRG